MIQQLHAFAIYLKNIKPLIQKAIFIPLFIAAYNSQDMETINRWLDKDVMMHIHACTLEYFSAISKQKAQLLSFVITWMEMEGIV